MKILYTLFNEDNRFGVCAIDIETKTPIEIIKDISVDKSFVENLIYRFNKYELSLIHLKDAIEDSLE